MRPHNTVINMFADGVNRRRAGLDLDSSLQWW